MTRTRTIEKDHVKAHMDALVTAVAAALGDSWAPLPRPVDDIDPERRYLVKPTGEKVNVSLNWHPTEHYRIHGLRPLANDGSTGNIPREVENETQSINCSVTKSAEQIARDIERRLLPGYYKVFQAIQDRNKAERDYESRRGSVATKLAGILGASPYDRNNRISHEFSCSGEPTVEIRPSSDSSQLLIRSCPNSLAERLLKVVAEYRAERTADSDSDKQIRAYLDISKAFWDSLTDRQRAELNNSSRG